MFIYQDHLNREYAKEARKVKHEYLQNAINPFREVAKIERKLKHKKN